MNPLHSHEIVVPVVAEEIVTGARTVARERVRVSTRTEAHDVDVDAVRAYESAVVERVPIDRAVDAVPAVRVEGNTTIIPVVEEVIVLERRLVLREEIRVTKHRLERPERVTVSLRRERAEVHRSSYSEEATHPNRNEGKRRGG